MPPWARQLGLLLLTFSVGCASGGPSWRFRREHVPSEPLPADAASTQESFPAETEQAQATREPLVAKSWQDPPTKHDPATRRLIETELRDATPREREEWLAALEGVESARVPYILKARRLQSRRAGEAVAANPGAPAPVIPVGHADPASIISLDTPEVKIPDVKPLTVPHLDELNGAVGTDAGEAGTEPATLTWSQKMKSLTDPAWLWPKPAAHDGEPSIPTERSERGPFGLPLLPGVQPRPEPGVLSETLSPVGSGTLEIASAVPATSPSPSMNELRIQPGAPLWEDELHKLISLLETETASAPGGGPSERELVRKQVALRMMHVIANDPQHAQQPIPGVSAAEQEFWTGLLLSLIEHLDDENNVSPEDRATQTLLQLRAAAAHLQRVARLQMRNVSFCDQINGFGNYESLPDSTFHAGQSVLIYADIRNFESEPTVDGFYRTRISSKVEILRGASNGPMVDRNHFEATEDRCRTMRSDYFHSYRIDLPPNLTSGPHVLRLTIKDELSGKTVSETLSFTIK